LFYVKFFTEYIFGILILREQNQVSGKERLKISSLNIKSTLNSKNVFKGMDNDSDRDNCDDWLVNIL